METNGALYRRSGKSVGVRSPWTKSHRMVVNGNNISRGGSSNRFSRMYSIRKRLARLLDAFFLADKCRYLVKNLLGVQAVLFALLEADGE